MSRGVDVGQRVVADVAIPIKPLSRTVHSATEERWFTLGLDARGRLLAVAHTYQASDTNMARVRIISAREATKRERRFYEDEPR